MRFPFPPPALLCTPHSVKEATEILAYGGLLFPTSVLEAILWGIFPWTLGCRVPPKNIEFFHNVAPLISDCEEGCLIQEYEIPSPQADAQRCIVELLDTVCDATEQIAKGVYNAQLPKRIYQSLDAQYRNAAWGDICYNELPTLAQNGEILAWYSPTKRGVMELTNVHVPRRLQRDIRSDRYKVTFDHAFAEVMLACASCNGRLKSGTWITQEFYATYCKLHELGVAHSAECWRFDTQSNKETLIGGVYGLAVNGFFEGESMFSAESNGSKIALFSLLSRLEQHGFKLFDLQVLNDHTRSLGGVEIDRTEYLHRLEDALLTPATF